MLRNLAFYLLITFSFVIVSLSTQKVQGQIQPQNGQIDIVQDSLVDSLLELHLKYNKLNKKMDGFRIQIYFESGNNSKTQAIEIRDEFNETFPDIRAYISFKEPYYRVRIGDYRTRLEADGILKSIRREYPNAFVIKDQINFPKLYEEQLIDSLEIIEAPE